MAWLAGALSSAGTAVGTAAGTAATTLGTLATKAGGAIATGAKTAGSAIASGAKAAGGEGSSLINSLQKMATPSLKPSEMINNGLVPFSQPLSAAQTTIPQGATNLPSGLQGLIGPSTPTQVPGYPAQSPGNPLLHNFLNMAGQRLTGGMVGVDQGGMLTLDPQKFGSFLQQRAAIRRQRQAQM